MVARCAGWAGRIGDGLIGDYLATLEGERRAALAHVVEVARRVAPEAEGGQSYGMPALRVDGRPLIGITASASTCRSSRLRLAEING